MLKPNQPRGLVLIMLSLGVGVALTAADGMVHPKPGYAASCTRTVSNTNDSGSGSLRQAILDSNQSSDLDVICFAIGSGLQTIIPASPLNPVTQPLIIDGSTQPGFASAPIIELNGAGAGAGADGLRITGNGSGSTIKSLIINRFSSHGLFLDSSNNTITGNYIGTNAAGSAAAGNGSDGIGIFSGISAASANGNVIGGTLTSTRNIISGNTGNGVGITAQNGGTANGNVVSGNYVGTDATGTTGIPNGGDGVLLNHPQGSATLTANVIGGITGVTVGGACTGSCNLLSGNGANGAGFWHSGAHGNSFIGNYVGTNAAGTGPIANGNIGLEVNETPNNTVGGTAPAARNVLSGNLGAGLFLTGAGATGNVVNGNYIGTNAAGTAPVGNHKMGIGIGASPNAVGANSNTIGGTTGVTLGGACTGACNLISGNASDGVFIAGSESFGNQFLGNYVGTNAAGTSSIGNALDGFGVLNTPNTTIGTSTSGARNIISGNGSNGVIIVGGASTGNRIEGNYIGQSTIGTTLGNTSSGVAVSSATDTAILGNGIAFNGILGIDLDNNGSVNPNHTGSSSGANHLQNFPDVYAANNLGAVTKIGGQFNSLASTSFQLDFFYSNGCNAGPPNNYGQGQNYAGSTSVTTDTYGNTAFGFTPVSQIPGNKYITATATRKIGNTADETSEFSKCVLVNAGKPAVTNGANWYLKDYLIPGAADKTFGYGFPSTLLMCAWDPNQPGVKLPVVVNGTTWFLRASYTTGPADLTFQYGFTGAKPVCGDWNGDGVDSPGLFNGTWYLRNSNSSGVADATFDYGGNSSGTEPIVGDWNGDGTDTIGVYHADGHWQLRDANSAGAATYDFFWSPPNVVKPVVGDWDGNGTDTIGVYDSGNNWIINNSNAAGPANGSFKYGFSGATPLVW